LNVRQLDESKCLDLLVFGNQSENVSLYYVCGVVSEVLTNITIFCKSCSPTPSGNHLLKGVWNWRDSETLDLFSQATGCQVKRVPSRDLVETVEKLVKEQDMYFLHSFDDTNLIAGYTRFVAVLLVQRFQPGGTCTPKGTFAYPKGFI